MFITFEGIEGCGKTTQIRHLANILKNHNIPFISTLEPGGTSVGMKIRQLLLDSNNVNLSPLAELILYAADRAQHVNEVIKPSLDRRKWVVCDRFFDATVVYQGIARGLDMELIQILNKKVTQGVRPDLTFLLDCPVDIGLNRAKKRNLEENLEGQDRFEREKLTFHEKVREGYLELARNNSDRFRIIDASNDIDKIKDEIFSVIKPFLKKHKELLSDG